MKLIVTACLLVFLVLGSFVPSVRAIETLPSNNPKFMAIHSIYENVARSFGDRRSPPKLFVNPLKSKSRFKVAMFFPGSESGVALEDNLSSSYIIIDERLFDLLETKFGKDRDSALTVVISHELAHFYKNHGWVSEFGNAFADKDMGKKMKTVASLEESFKIETEADYFGGFYGYLAGYRTLGLTPEVVDAIYKDYKLPDVLENYPSREERGLIARNSENKLSQLLPLFDGATRLLLLDRFEEAARILDRVSNEFPGREIYNNAGVAHLLAAIELFQPEELAYVFPFQIDVETRLSMKGERGATEDAKVARDKLLNEAARDFDAAISRDPDYSTAYINRAVVHVLLDELDDARYKAKKGLNSAIKYKEIQSIANSHIIMGIIWAKQNEPGKAEAEFKFALPDARKLAEWNLGILKNVKPPTTKSHGKEIVSFKPELIGEQSPEKVVDLVSVVDPKTLRQPGSLHADLKLYERKNAEYVEFLAELPEMTVKMLLTTPKYTGASARGIKIGSSRQDLIKLYGDAARVVSAKVESYHVYKGAEIIFTLNAKDVVTGWMIFEISGNAI